VERMRGDLEEGEEQGLCGDGGAGDGVFIGREVAVGCAAGATASRRLRRRIRFGDVSAS
jgi:hypothetical protein